MGSFIFLRKFLNYTVIVTTQVATLSRAFLPTIFCGRLFVPGQI